VSGRIDRRLLWIAALLVLVGFVVLYSASAPFSLRHYGSGTHMLAKQVIAALVGIVLLIGFARFDYHRLAAINDVLLVGAIGLTAITLLPIGFVDGRWISLGPFAFQPTECLKLTLIVYLAAAIARKGERVRSFGHGVLPFLAVLAVLGALVLNQPDLGMLLIYAALTVAMLFFGGANLWHLAGIVGAGLPLVALAIRLAPYRFARILSFLDPRAYSTSSGYQTMQSLIAVGSGGLLGRGLGASRAKLFYLPQAHNDFILSIVAEETGLVGTLVILGLIGLLVWRAFVISERAPDRLGQLLAFGIGFTIGFQALVNAGVVVGILPVTGMTFPFLSNGGSSLIVTLAMVGVLLNVSRHGDQEGVAQ